MRIAERFAEEIMPKHLNSAMIQRLKWHQSQGHRCMVISRSFDLYTRPWAESLGISEISVTQLEVSSEDRFTGRILGESCAGDEKVRRLKSLLHDRNDYLIYAYGDSPSDQALLDEADYGYYLRSDRSPFPAHPTPTALITGASSGIGYELAKRFAKEGYRLILIGRDSQALFKLTQECKEFDHVPAVSIVKDLTQPNAAREIVDELNQKNIAIDVLVNNAGVGLWGEFLNTKVQDEIALVQLQITFTLTLTKLLLPSMQEQGAAKILNVGSIHSFTPVPFQSVYSASKAFLRSFTESLREELRGTGVSVTLLCPGITTTRFRERAGVCERKTPFVMSAQKVAEMAYQGLMGDKAVVVPGLFNRAYIRGGRLFSARWISWLI
jgi:short-subunit dehydrogenase